MFDHISEKALRLFVTWLLFRKIDDSEDDEENSDLQTALAEAWNFGAEYNVPQFQNAIMCEVLDYIGSQTIQPEAVREAYRPSKRGTLLQRAFVTHLAKDMCLGNGDEWERAVFKEHDMEDVAGFYLDLVQAMGAACECNDTVANIEELLVSEQDE